MTPETKETIKEDFNSGTWTAYELSAHYDVSYTDVLKTVGEHYNEVRMQNIEDREIRRKKAMQKLKTDRELGMKASPRHDIELIIFYNKQGSLTPCFTERLRAAKMALR